MTPEVTALVIQSAFSLAANVAPEVIKLFGNKMNSDDIATLESFQDLVTRIDFDQKVDALMDEGDNVIMDALIAREEKEKAERNL